MNYFNQKHMYLILNLLFGLLFFCCSDNNNEGNNKVNGNGEVGEQPAIILHNLPIADPFILLHDNEYYAYGTSGDDGFDVYYSDDLIHWQKHHELALDRINSFGDRWFWAPEVYYNAENKKFYLYYSADEHICVATSDSPLGPFIQAEKKPMREEKCIDSSIFVDDNGTPYIYFVRFTDGNVIWGAELEKDLVTIKEGTLTECIKVTEDWEKVMGKVTEGPSIVKRSGTYYLIYSANDYQSQYYGVGYATASSPLGSWDKYANNPIFQNPDNSSTMQRPEPILVGVGHGAPFIDKDGNYKYMFHAHFSVGSVHPRTSFIADMAFSNDGVVSIGGPIINPKVIKSEEYVLPKNIYKNPVIDKSLPDPTIIKAEDGYFYLYATEDTRNTPIYKTKNLIDWDFVGTAFTDNTRPTFEPNGGLWAPDINYINGQYVLYYSMSEWGGVQTCGIGAAVSDSPAGPFTDKGKLFISNEIGVTNSIDQFYIEDDGKKYMFWGSFHDLYVVELSDDGLSVKNGDEKIKVAGNAFEGVYVHKRNGYYYLFGSIGTCCEGANSTYQLVVGRSQNLFGPYVDKSGNDMKNNGFDIVIGPNNRFVGNGHCSEIVQDNDGQDWILYHGVDVKNPNGRVLLLDQVKWTNDNWPYVEGNTPSLSSEKPVF